MKVRVHFNLHTHLWSITAREGEKKGRVFLHLPSVKLVSARMIVSEPTRQKVCLKKQRAVHAWVEGSMVEFSEIPGDAREFTYNPYRAATFTDRETGDAVLEAKEVWFSGKKAYYR